MDKDVSKGASGILINHDDPVICVMAIEILHSISYRVDSVLNGNETINAYKTAQETGDSYGVVILDLTITEEIGGKEVFRMLREIDPEVKAIVSSGYAAVQAIIDYASHGFWGHS